MGLNFGRGRPDARRGRARRGPAPGRWHDQAPGERPELLAAFQACPVAVDGARAGEFHPSPVPAGPAAATRPAGTWPTAQPAATWPDATQPAATWPAATQPTPHRPTPHRPTAAQPAGTRPAGPGLLSGGPSWAADDSFGLDALLAAAEQFVTLFHTENRAGAPDGRLARVRREIGATGTYRHTPAELEFGARVAWRNSSRCIGRLYWQSLRVRDRREITAAADIAAESAAHLREATNGGRVRPLITVFAPDTPERPGPRILNPQLVRYAGHRAPDGTVTGDPANTDLTRLARDLGWAGGQPPGRFDILPLIVAEDGERVSMHDVPAGAVLEIPLSHPDLAWFADLGLRWYSVPVISDMYLAVGGVCYPATPFNGWYMGTEIGSRNLGDTGRYDQLPVIAEHMGLSTASNRTLWKDRAMTELNVAVLHSFGAAGVTISDHHTESARFLQHIAREEQHGRACPADWTWIVPPAASSATPVFHRTYQDFDQTPNFYRHPDAGQYPRW